MNDRIYQGTDQKWYYRARGNRAVGPFDSWALAEQSLHRHIRGWAGRPAPKAATWSIKLPTPRFLRRSANRQT